MSTVLLLAKVCRFHERPRDGGRDRLLMAWNIVLVLLALSLVQVVKEADGTTNHTDAFANFSAQGNTASKISDEYTQIYFNQKRLLAAGVFGNDVYLSASVFRPNYEQMFADLKIYVYPPKAGDFGSPQWCSSQKLGDLGKPWLLFYESLVSSHFITDNPENAHLFLLPFSVDALATSSSLSVSRFLRRYVDELRSEYPYWNRTLGADHFYVSCEGIDIDSSRNVVELKKNAIQVSCYPLPLGGNARFIPHKDISMPPIGSVMSANQALQFDDHEIEHRTTLAYSVIPAEAIPGFDSAFNLWKSDLDFVFGSLHLEPSLHAQRLSSSRFCLNFMDGGGNSSGLIDALIFGCIPVIVSNGPVFDLPFQDVLNWPEFSVVVNTRQIGNLKTLLQNISEARCKKMQILAKAASKHFKWNSPPKPYDAFYSLMYQLWLRRHTIRYARRHISS